MKKITDFKGKNSFLSRSFPCDVVYQGLHYCSVESAYQASLCLQFEDRYGFTGLNASQAKGRIKNISHRADSTEQSIVSMSCIVFDKFCRNPELLDCLLRTRYADIEETSGNLFWGIDKKTGKGENWYGKILQSARTLLNSQFNKTFVRFQDGNINVGYKLYEKILTLPNDDLPIEQQIYTVPLQRSLEPYTMAVNPDSLKDVMEFQFGTLTGKVIQENGKRYPLVAFSPELLMRTGDGIDSYEMQANITPQQRNMAQQYYYWCREAFTTVQYLEAWIGCMVNENQLVHDFLEARSFQSLYPYRRTQDGITIEYAVENVSQSVVSMIIFDGMNEFPLNIDKTSFHQKNIGFMLIQETKNVLNRVNAN